MHADTNHEHVSTEFDCTTCGRELLHALADRTAHCPNCDRPYSIVSRQGFTLVTTNGWVDHVAMESDGEPTRGPAGE